MPLTDASRSPEDAFQDLWRAKRSIGRLGAQLVSRGLDRSSLDQLHRAGAGIASYHLHDLNEDVLIEARDSLKRALREIRRRHPGIAEELEEDALSVLEEVTSDD